MKGLGEKHSRLPIIDVFMMHERGFINNTISAVCHAKQFVIPAVILLNSLMKNRRKWPGYWSTLINFESRILWFTIFQTDGRDYKIILSIHPYRFLI
jgi:hypothetical protein